MDGRVILRGSALARTLFVFLVNALATGLSPLRVTAFQEYRVNPASQHNDGTALDLGMRTAAEASAARALAARWRALGLTALEESGGESGSTGPHVHLQLFSAGRDTL